MRHFGISTLAVVLFVVSGCASSSGAKTYATHSPQDATSVTTTTSAMPTPTPTPAPANDTPPTMLTSGAIGSPSTSSLVGSPTVSHEVAPRWTEEQIVAALAAAQ